MYLHVYLTYGLSGTLFYMYILLSYQLQTTCTHALAYFYIVVVCQLVLCLSGECFSKKRR